MYWICIIIKYKYILGYINCIIIIKIICKLMNMIFIIINTNIIWYIFKIIIVLKYINEFILNINDYNIFQ